jgi:hypothetical protein
MSPSRRLVGYGRRLLPSGPSRMFSFQYGIGICMFMCIPFAQVTVSLFHPVP